jgi:hypothetical protein
VNAHDKAREFADAAKRASDRINLHLTFTPWDELKHKWIAVRLTDGDSDGVLYDNKRDAVRHQLNEFQCAYISFRNLAGGASPKDMALFLQFCRDAYDAGFRLPDPDDVNGGMDVLPTTARMDSLLWTP